MCDTWKYKCISIYLNIHLQIVSVPAEIKLYEFSGIFQESWSSVQ